MDEQYKLYYFPFRSRGEFIRYIFAYANVPYTNIVISMQEWPSKKNEMPFGVVPVLELENGLQLSQSLAIGRYLATKYGLISNDALENAIGDQIASAIEDLYLPYFRPWVRAFAVKDTAKMEELWNIAEKDGVIPLFNRLEKLLGDKKWFCGQNVHWTDLYVAELIDRLETALNKHELVGKYPYLLDHCRRVHQIPNIKKYVDSRPKYPF